MDPERGIEMEDVLGKLTKKTIAKFKEIEDDRVYRQEKVDKYNKQIATLDTEIDELGSKSSKVTGSSKDSLFDKIETLTLKKIELVQLADNFRHKDVTSDVLELIEIHNEERKAIDKRYSELFNLIKDCNSRKQEAESKFDQEWRGLTHEQTILFGYHKAIVDKVNTLLAESAAKYPSARELLNKIKQQDF